MKIFNFFSKKVSQSMTPTIKVEWGLFISSQAITQQNIYALIFYDRKRNHQLKYFLFDVNRFFRFEQFLD